jgi:hypothetical protein
VTDSRHYGQLSAATLRFTPYALTRKTDVARVHGTNERSSLSHFRGALCTTKRLTVLLGGGGGGSGGASSSSGGHTEL